jgi:hypothetical protein
MVSNKNTQKFLASSNFKMIINKTPVVAFTCTTVKLPDISTNYAIQSRYALDIKQPGDKLTFGTLEVTYIIHEDLDNYKVLKTWLEQSVAHKDGGAYTNLIDSDSGLFSDITIIVMDNNENPICEFVCTRCFPSSVSSPAFTTTANEDVVEGSVSFEVTDFIIRNIVGS